MSTTFAIYYSILHTQVRDKLHKAVFPKKNFSKQWSDKQQVLAYFPHSVTNIFDIFSGPTNTSLAEVFGPLGYGKTVKGNSVTINYRLCSNRLKLMGLVNHPVQ